MSEQTEVKATKESRVKPLDSYSPEELVKEGEKAIQKKLEALKRSQENFANTKTLIYARKKRACAVRAVMREVKKFKDMRRAEKQEVDRVNRDKRFRKARHYVPSEMIHYLREQLEELEEDDEEEEEDDEVQLED